MSGNICFEDSGDSAFNESLRNASPLGTSFLRAGLFTGLFSGLFTGLFTGLFSFLGFFVLLVAMIFVVLPSPLRATPRTLTN